MRIRFRDAKGIIASVGEIFAKNGASIFSILQNPIKDRDDDYFVVVTEPVSNANIKRVCMAQSLRPLNGIRPVFGSTKEKGRVGWP